MLKKKSVVYQVAVYMIATGGDKLLGYALDKMGILLLVDGAAALGATGVSLHGKMMGSRGFPVTFSGEVETSRIGDYVRNTLKFGIE